MYFKINSDAVELEQISPSVRRLIVPFSFAEWQNVLAAHHRRDEVERKRAEKVKLYIQICKIHTKYH